MKLNLYIHYHPISIGPICLTCNQRCTVDTVHFESNSNSLFEALNEKLHWNKWAQVKKDLGGSYIYDRYMILDHDMNYTYVEKEMKCKSVLNSWQDRIQTLEELHIIALM
jgi:hypothetical protein